MQQKANPGSTTKSQQELTEDVDNLVRKQQSKSPIAIQNGCLQTRAQQPASVADFFLLNACFIYFSEHRVAGHTTEYVNRKLEKYLKNT